MSMLSNLRCVTSRPHICSGRLVLCSVVPSTSCRSLHATRLALSELGPEPIDEQGQPAQSSDGATTSTEEPKSLAEELNPEHYTDFMQTIGAQFKKADAPKKWLGGRVVEWFIVVQVYILLNNAYAAFPYESVLQTCTTRIRPCTERYLSRIHARPCQEQCEGVITKISP
jgi:hypothetical protein